MNHRANRRFPAHWSMIRIVAAAAALGLFAAGSSSPAGSAGLVRAAGPAAHLYVSDPALHRILRFPLAAAGIPAPTPDGVITGLQSPSGLAVGPDGRLYVVDVATSRLAIYAPGPGTGSLPARLVPLPHTRGLGAVGVDGHGFVYTGYDLACGEGSPCAYADVFAPLSDGDVRPFTTYSLGGSPPVAFVGSLVVNAEQKLAVVAAGQPDIYTDAPKRPHETPYPLFCPPVIGWGAAWGPANTLFLSDNGALHHPAQASQIVVIPNYLRGSIPNCPASYAIESATIPLEHPLGIATEHGLIYATSAYNAKVKSGLVFVFDAFKPGKQRPLALIGGPGAQLATPFALAIGP